MRDHPSPSLEKLLYTSLKEESQTMPTAHPPSGPLRFLFLFCFFLRGSRERGWEGGNVPEEAAASLPIGHLLPSGEEPWPGFPCISLEQTQMIQEMLSQKGLLRGGTCGRGGGVGRDPCSRLSLCCLQSPYINSLLSPPLTFQVFIFTP